MADERRVSTAGVYTVLGNNGPRISTAGVYVVHGPNERRVTTAGVYVVALEAPPPPVTVAPTVSIDQSGPLDLDVGSTAQLTATATGDPAPTLAWSSNDEAVATVDAAGLVTAMAAGIATITVTASNGTLPDASDSIVLSIATTIEAENVAALWDNGERTKWIFVKNPQIVSRTGPSNPIWDGSKYICQVASGFAPLTPPGVWMLGGETNDLSLLAMLDLGSGRAFEVSGEVAVTAIGNWVGSSYYLNQRSVRAGVGMGLGYGVVDSAPSWFGIAATLTPGSYAEHNAGPLRGTARARLGLTLLDYADTIYGVPSKKGYAGRWFSPMDVGRWRMYNAWAQATYNAGAAGARWFCSPDAEYLTQCPTHGCDDSTYSEWDFVRVTLRVTQAQPGYIRIQARAEGAMIDPPTLGGWHVDRIIGQPLNGPTTSLFPARPMELDCGWAGYAGHQYFDVSSFQRAWGMYRGFEATVLDAGDCNPLPPPPYVPPEEPPPLPEMPDPPPDWDEEWIVFEEDDVTAYYWASALYPYSTNPALILGEPLGESSIDLVGGRSVIGQINVRVLDKRTDPADQSTGHLTAALADTVRTRLIGRRGLRRRWIEDMEHPRGGYFHVILDGVVGAVALEGDFVTYSHPTRDIRERERKMRAFHAANTSTILPAGVLNGFGSYGENEWLAPPTAPFVVPYVQDAPADQVSAGRGWFDLTTLWISGTYTGSEDPVVPKEVVVTDAMLKAMEAEVEYGEPYEEWVPDETIVPEGGFYRTTYPAIYHIRGASVMWRPTGTEDWTEIRDMILPGGSIYFQLVATRPNSRLGSSSGEAVRAAARIYVQGFDLPADAESCDVIIRYYGPPTEDYPLHLEGMTAGELLAALYDGEYSAAEGFRPIRYDEGAVLALTEPVMARVTEPITDLRSWTEEHIYKPLGYAPALRQRNEIEMVIWPVRLDPLDAAADLPTLDGSVVIAEDSDWRQEDGTAVNVARVTYPRFYLPASADEAGGDGIAVRTVSRERLNAASVSLIGEAPWEAGTRDDPLIFGSVGTPEGGVLEGAPPEAGTRLLAERWAVFTATRLFGAQRWVLPCRWSATRDLHVGDEVRVTVPWWPDYATGRRGMDRVGVIVSLSDPDYGRRIITVEDAEDTTVQSG